ncbi:MAG TPA: OmpA family protein [Casimicrobiaceae bacterium]|jgi:outer membrane protein OmpA-like peptidoglycan-associated protein
MIELPTRASAWAVVALLASLCACAQRGTVVLLPEKDGKPTAVVVKQDGRETVLDQPYAAARQTPFGVRAYTSTPEEVTSKFGTALGSQPQRAVTFTLYFIEGKDEFTEESKRVVEVIFAEIARRPVPDVIVVGHSDAVGSDQFNDALARQRAETVRAELMRRGVAPENIQASGRGKRDLLIPTADGVAEPRNRRVEIFVR